MSRKVNTEQAWQASVLRPCKLSTVCGLLLAVAIPYTAGLKSYGYEGCLSKFTISALILFKLHELRYFTLQQMSCSKKHIPPHDT